MTEQEFVDLVDHNFPYHDRLQWEKLIKQGSSISSNASFAVLYEMCCPPYGADVNPKQLKEIVEYWSQL